MGEETGSKKPLGKIMLQQKLVTADQLKELVVEQQRSGERLASVATRGGRITIPDALSALSEQHKLPPADVTQMVIDLGLLKLVPKVLAEERRALPFEIVGDSLSVAMASPDDREALEELNFLTDKTIVPHVALDGALMDAIAGAYAALAKGETHYDGSAVAKPPGPDMGQDAETSPGGAPAPVPMPVPAAAGEQALPVPPAAMMAPPPAADQAQTAAESRVQPVVPQAVPVPMPAPAMQPNVEAAPAAIAMSPQLGEQLPPQPEGAAPQAAPVPIPAPAPAIAPPAPPTQQDAPAAPAPEDGGDAPDELLVDAAPRGGEMDSVGPDLDAAFAEGMTPSIMPSQREYTDASVLLANVEPQLRGALREALELNGIPVAEVDSGRDVLSHLQASAPNMLLLDTELMEMSGFDVCRRIRNTPQLETLPVIMTSGRHRGWRFEADLRECFRIRHYFEMPIDVPELTRTIRLELEGERVIPIPVDLSAEAQAELDSSMEAFEQGDLDKAITHLEAGASMTPDAFRLQYHLGLLYGRRGDLFLAISALEHAVDKQPRHFSALKNLAVVYQRVGFRYRAIETWQRAMWCSPDEDTRAGIKEHVAALL